ncbi:MAG TPA: hypothetical protein VGK25_05440 [Ignavibacteria bacterium]|jgi:hypothetical protein
MAVFLTRSECRQGMWHVITYDISTPDNWIEIEDLPTTQPCSEAPATIAITRLSNKEAKKLGLKAKKKKGKKDKKR